MKPVVDVGVGRVVVTNDSVVLRAIALGSCIGAVAYDAGGKFAGMAHIMLPGRAPDNAEEKTRYAADAIDELLGAMTEAGVKLGKLDVCLVGAANVLRRDDDTICRNNIESVTSILEDKGIEIKASALGGTHRKSVSVDLQTGDVFYTVGNGGKTLLWKAGERR